MQPIPDPSSHGLNQTQTTQEVDSRDSVASQGFAQPDVTHGMITEKQQSMVSSSTSRGSILIMLGVSVGCMGAALYISAAAAVIGTLLSLDAIKKSIVLPKFTFGIILGVISATINLYFMITGILFS